MSTIAMKLQVGIAGCAVAAAATLTPIAAQAAPVPVPVAPIQVLEKPLQTGFLGGIDLLQLPFLNNNGGTDMSTIWNPVNFFRQIIAVKVAIVTAIIRFLTGYGPWGRL